MLNGASVSRDGAFVRVSGSFALGMKLRELPAATWDGPARSWVFPATAGAARALVEVVGEHPTLGELLGADLAPREDPLPHAPETFAPWRHQVRGTWHLVDKEGGRLLQYGLGTGKTRVALDGARVVGAKRVLVVCPRAVIPAWRQQAALHAGKHFAVWTGEKGSSVADKAKRLATTLKTVGPKPLLAVVNYEMLWREPFAALATRTAWDVVIYDECHRIKAPGSKCSRFAARLRSCARRSWGLSGTPLAHSPLDAYGIFRALDPGIFGTSYRRFLSRYAVMGGFQNHQVIRYQNVEEFRRLYYSITLAESRDVLDLPEAHHVEVPVELPSTARMVYSGIRDEFTAELASGQHVTAGHALTRLLRLQQVTSGSVPTDEDGTAAELHSEKEDALAELLGDLDPAEPAVVFCRFRADLDRVHRAAKEAGRASYELSGAQRQLEAWQTAKDGSVLAVQIQSGGEGIDLTRARYCFYFSVPLSLAQYDQSLARVHRPGQTRPVTYYHLIASATVDGYIYRLLRKRREVIDAVLSDGLTEE